MTTKKTKDKKVKRPKGWNHLIVARLDSLPKGVYLIFRTSAASPESAANSKRQALGIPGAISVVGCYPIQKVVGKKIYQDMLSELKPFPYGDFEGFVKEPPSEIANVFARIAEAEPAQVELHSQLLESQIAEYGEELREMRDEKERMEEEIERYRKEIQRQRKTKDKLELEIEYLRSEADRLKLEIDATFDNED